MMASTARHRSFAPAKNTKTVPLTFDLLDGKYEFECKAVLQGAVILDFVAASDGGATTGAAHMLDFFDYALKDATEIARFKDVVRSTDESDNIEIEDLGNIVAWLIEEYTSRPTLASVPSDATS